MFTHTFVSSPNRGTTRRVPTSPVARVASSLRYPTERRAVMTRLAVTFAAGVLVGALLSAGAIALG
jgi:hypothetical protein